MRIYENEKEIHYSKENSLYWKGYFFFFFGGKEDKLFYCCDRLCG